MSIWATTDDIEARYESTVPERAQALLDDAETLLRHEFRATNPTLAQRIALSPTVAGYLDPALLTLVLVNAVIRILRNPKGISWERDGDYSYGNPLNQKAQTTGGVWFTPEELEMLRPGAAWSNVGTITVQDRYKAPRDRPVRTDLDAWSEDPNCLTGERW